MHRWPARRPLCEKVRPDCMLRSIARTYSAFRLHYVQRQLLIRDVPRPLFTPLIAGMAELAQKLLGLRVRPARRVYSKVHGLFQEGREWVIRSPKLWEKNAVWSYKDSLTHTDLRKKSQATRRYEERHMEVTAELFCTWALKLIYVAADSKGRSHQV